MKKIYVIILCLTFLSCEKDPIKEGVVTNIQGTVTDIRNRVPFENLKLKVAEYKSHPSSISVSYEFIQWLDSTYTDSNGNYNLDFETSGKGDYYRLEVEEKKDLWTYYYNPIEIDSIGKINHQDLDFLHLYPINLEIVLNDLDFTPIKIYVDVFSDLQSIESNNGNIERILYTDKNSDTEITFSRKNMDDEYESYTVIIPASNTSNLTSYNLSISNSDFN